MVINASKDQPTVINAVGGRKVKIGDSALLSNNIEIHTTDYHGIFNREGKRINPDKDISIGKGVWIGLGCKILKGTSIAEGSIVGAGSLLSGKYDEPYVVMAGNPVRILKHDCFWSNSMDDSCCPPVEFLNRSSDIIDTEEKIR